MPRRKKVLGKCKICGKEGQLSFEHVPPDAAFNNKKHYYATTIDEITNYTSGPLFDFEYLFSNHLANKKQGGVGFHSICQNCNNETGSWYGRGYIEWVFQSMNILQLANGSPSLIYPINFYPLQAIKQVITMFFSLHHLGFNEEHPSLVNFIKNKEERFLDKKYRLFCYYNVEGKMRYIGDNFIYDLQTGKSFMMGELTFPPLGFVLTINGSSPDKRLTEITDFSQYPYYYWGTLFQKFNVLPTHLPFSPCDYRTEDEIRSALNQDKIDFPQYY